MISDAAEEFEGEESDQDSSDEGFQRIVFDILEDVSNYCVDDVPVDGHQFLKKVKAEAATCPKVKVAEMNDNIRKNKQNFFVQENEIVQIPRSFLPSQKWQMEQIQNFDNLRGEIGHLRENKPEYKQPKMAPPQPIEKWYEFFYGEERPEPKLSQILRLDQQTLISILLCITKWLDESQATFDQFTCCWIYAILACLEMPLMPDTYHNLRTLAYQAVKARRSVVNEDDELLTRVNLIVCLVGRYFRQIDLADKF